MAKKKPAAKKKASKKKSPGKKKSPAKRRPAKKKPAKKRPVRSKNVVAVPPIHDVDAIDVVGKRSDGAVDLVIVVDARLEDTDAHRELLGEKLNTYLATIALAEFQVEMGRGPYRIIVTSKSASAAPAFEAWLRGLAPTIQEHGAELVVDLAGR